MPTHLVSLNHSNKGAAFRGGPILVPYGQLQNVGEYSSRCHILSTDKATAFLIIFSFR